MSNPTGNVNIVYAAFDGSGVYISPNRGQVSNQMAGGVGDPLIQTTSHRASRRCVANNGVSPDGVPMAGSSWPSPA